MLSFETLFVEIGLVDLEIFDLAVFSEIHVVKNDFLQLRKKFLGHIKIFYRFLFHSSRAFIWALNELCRARFVRLGLGQTDCLGAPSGSHQKLVKLKISQKRFACFCWNFHTIQRSSWPSFWLEKNLVRTLLFSKIENETLFIRGFWCDSKGAPKESVRPRPRSRNLALQSSCIAQMKAFNDTFTTVP